MVIKNKQDKSELWKDLCDNNNAVEVQAKTNGFKYHKMEDLLVQKKIIHREYTVNLNSEEIFITSREYDILRCVTSMTSLQIADHLSLSIRTIEFYMSGIRKKLCCRTKKDLVYLIHTTKLLERVRRYR